MAAIDYKSVRNALVSERETTGKVEQKHTCIDLIQKIDELYAVHIDKALTFEEALVLTEV